MWDKSVRVLVFTAIYEDLFWAGEGVVSFDLDWELVADLNGINDQELIHQAKQYYLKFKDSRDAFEVRIKPFMQSWQKTFDIVKAVLYTAVLELDGAGSNYDGKDKIIGKYIHLTQDMVGGKNPALVHAVLSKLTA
jgi:transcription termination factor NusB